jgi:hypothetical protein
LTSDALVGCCVFETGTYTAQASQYEAAGNVGLSSASTFMVNLPPGPCGVLPTPPATVKHVIWIMLENKSYSDIVGNTAQAPYENQLAVQCGAGGAYFAVAHPSLPNYIATTSGGTQGIADDAYPDQHPLGVESIFSQAAPLPGGWRAYEESMADVPCQRYDTYPYQPYHNPPLYYTGLASDCPARDVSMGTTTSGNFVNDLTNDTLPAFAFITPDQYDNMHTGVDKATEISTGDAWLQSWVPKITASTAYQTGQLVLFITWDEDDYNLSNQIPLFVISPYTHPGTASLLQFTHYSLLRTTEELLGIGTYLGEAATAPSMRSAFGL